jgi:polysaccharide pyruvyl transferase WcaK-like protein
MRLAVPFGFYGWGNIGDESTLQGFARLTRVYDPDARVWVGSANPSHTARVEPSLKYFRAADFDPRRWWAKRCASAHVFAGGTPIMDLEDGWPLTIVGAIVVAARAARKAVAFMGIGSEHLPAGRARDLMSSVLASGVAHWSVRSERDKQRLTDCGARPESVTVAADMAWLLNSQSADFGRNYLSGLGLDNDAQYVGVNINSEAHMLEREPRLIEKLSQFLDTLVERRGFRILFLCNEVREDASFDKATSLRIASSMRRKESAFLVPNEYFTPQQMMSLIACCRFAVSTRYHFCVFSALQRVPFLALERSDKVADLCWDLGWRYRASLAAVDGQLADAFFEMEKRAPDLHDQFVHYLGKMRERAVKNIDALAAVNVN